MKELITLGLWLKATRIVYGETIGEMAKNLSVTTSYLSQVESHHQHADENLINEIRWTYVSDGDVMEVFDSVMTKHLGTPLHTPMAYNNNLVFKSVQHDQNNHNCECNECRMVRTEAEIKEKEHYEELGRALDRLYKENTFVTIEIEKPCYDFVKLSSIEELLKLFRESQEVSNGQS